MEGTSIVMKVFLIRKHFVAVYLTNERLCSYNQMLVDVFHSNGFTKAGFYLKVVLKCLFDAYMLACVQTSPISFVAPYMPVHVCIA